MLDLPSFFRYKCVISLKRHLLLAQGVFPTGFGATFAAVFILIYWFREFPSFVVANRFELKCQQLLLLYYKICPCFAKHVTFFDSPNTPFSYSWTCSKSRPWSINKREGSRRRKGKGKGKESETCGLRVPKMRLGIRLLKFDWLFR